MDLRIDVLGPLQAWRDGRPLTLGPPRRQAVLAVLALRAGQTVSRDQIVDAVWGDAPPASAVNNVHVYIGGLRRTLEATCDPGSGPRVLRSAGSGYRLELDPGRVDLAEFEEHLRRARRLAADGEFSAAVAAFDAGLALWRGPALAGVTGPFADAQRFRLAELRLAALEDRAESLLCLGQDANQDANRDANLVAELSALADEHPLRERLRALLMRALHDAGRRAEALSVYADTRRLLVDELGVEPGAALRALHRAVLADGDCPPARPSFPPGGMVPRQLPPPLARLAGRSAELTVLNGLSGRAAAGGTPIGTIDGTAGVGKTALAVFWAHSVAEHFPDGQLYVNLRGFDPVGPATSPGSALRLFLDALGVPADRIPVDVDAQAALYRSRLAGRRLLVLLDNARDVEQVRPLLPGTGGCATVVTGRRQLLGLVAGEGAEPLTLDLLTAAGARQLMADRIGTERIAAEPDVVDGIIARCARLPLALSLAAALAVTRPRFPLAALAAEMSDAGTNVRAVFSWSYDALGGAAARLFRLLGLHPGADFSVQAAAGLAGLPVAGTRQLLAELVRANLVTEHSPGRFALHDLLRAYAAELTREVDPDQVRHAAVHRLLDFYLHTAHAATMLVTPLRDGIGELAPALPGVVRADIADRAGALEWFATEHDVLVSAVTEAAATGFDVHAWQLAWTGWTVLSKQGRWCDQAQTAAVALDATRRLGDPRGQAFAQRALVNAYGRLSRFGDAHRHVRCALELDARLGDDIGRAHDYRLLAWVFEQEGDLRGALRNSLLALDLYRATGHTSGQAYALNATGWYHSRLGEHRRALCYCEQALDLHRRVGNRNAQANTLDSIGHAHHRLGDHDKATACYRAAIELHREVGERYDIAATLARLGDVQHDTGDLRAARAAWREALDILELLGHREADEVRAKLLGSDPEYRIRP